MRWLLAAYNTAVKCQPAGFCLELLLVAKGPAAYVQPS